MTKYVEMKVKCCVCGKLISTSMVEVEVDEYTDREEYISHTYCHECRDVALIEMRTMFSK